MPRPYASCRCSTPSCLSGSDLPHHDSAARTMPPRRHALRQSAAVCRRGRFRSTRFVIVCRAGIPKADVMRSSHALCLALLGRARRTAFGVLPGRYALPCLLGRPDLVLHRHHGDARLPDGREHRGAGLLGGASQPAPSAWKRRGRHPARPRGAAQALCGFGGHACGGEPAHAHLGLQRWRRACGRGGLGLCRGPGRAGAALVPRLPHG